MLALVIYITDFQKWMLISGPAEDSTSTILPVATPQALAFIKSLWAVTTASQLSLSYFQQSLNNRLGTFAGSHRSAAAVRLASGIVGVASGMESVVGAYSTKPGVSWEVVVAALFAASEAWQALTLRSVKEGEKEHEE
jgi:hypothetical protein